MAMRQHVPVGPAAYGVREDEACDIRTPNSTELGGRVGTALVDITENAVREARCSRTVVTTMNDNLRALRFYRKIGCGLRQPGARGVGEARHAKPQIPATGLYGIPVGDRAGKASLGFLVATCNTGCVGSAQV